MTVRRNVTLAAAAAATAATVVLGLVSPVAASGDSTVKRSKDLREAVTVRGIQAHQAALQRIADANNGTRLAGTSGFDASVAYVVSKARRAGLVVTTQTFPFRFNTDATPPVLTKTSGTPASFADGADFASMTYSANGDVTAAVTLVDAVEPPGAHNSSTSGCEAADFAGFTLGDIALVQRGTCSFAAKAVNAEAAGASAVVVYNEGQPGRTAVIQGTLGAPDLVTIPVVGATYAVGTALRGDAGNGRTGVTARVRVDRADEDRTSTNVIAETRRGDPHNVVVVGAHLDSVSRGPGINDNGSGTAGILEIAEAYMDEEDGKARNKLRFVWWGAEEFGLLGSQYYVGQLTPEQTDDIALNLNFDMIGSPNYVRFVYDGDNSAFPVGPGAAQGPDGSGQIEKVFHDFFAAERLASAETPFSGRSDYGPFIAAGIPAGGLFTGAEGEKTVEEAAVYGGTAGVAYDACYHLACDTYANTSRRALSEMSDAAAHAVYVYSKQNFAKVPLTNPVGAVSGATSRSGGGGLHADHDHDTVDR